MRVLIVPAGSRGDPTGLPADAAEEDPSPSPTRRGPTPTTRKPLAAPPSGGRIGPGPLRDTGQDRGAGRRLWRRCAMRYDDTGVRCTMLRGGTSRSMVQRT